MKTQIGFGASANAMWWNASPAEIARYSPLLALARYEGVPMQPYLINASATFVEGGPTVLPPISWEANGNGGASADQFIVVDRVIFEIDAPNAGDGAFLKGLNDFYFARQSGIEAILTVLGRPQYVVAPFYTPIAAICAMINEGWPMGWVIQYTQALQYSFRTSIPLPSFPTTITVTHRMWTPVGDRFRQMGDYAAAAELAKVGIECGSYYKLASTP